TPGVMHDFRRFAMERPDTTDELDQARCICGAAAQVERPAGQALDCSLGKLEGGDEIVDVEDVAHLAPVAVDGDRVASERAKQEMRHPSLVLGAELARPVDAAHAEYHGAKAVAARVVKDVLVGGALGAAV